MANYLSLFIHLVWATDGRRPLLGPDIEPQVYQVILAKCRALGCPAIAIGGMPDHVHLLAELHPTRTIAELAKEIKGASSHAATRAFGAGQAFRWQTGYGAFSTSRPDVPRVKAYIQRQKEHHASGTLLPSLEYPTPPSPISPPDQP